MVTTIQISKDLLERLRLMKLHEKESYEDTIWDLIEDKMELSEQTKKNIAEAEEDIRKGRVHKWEDVVKELKINVSNNRFR
jgi:predicted CopG family antitoxin